MRLTPRSNAPLHTCYFCNQAMPDIETAVHEGWVPEFLVAGEEEDREGPVCPDCQQEHLTVDDETGMLIADPHDPKL